MVLTLHVILPLFCKNSSDTPLLMNLNQMKAARQLVFSIVKDCIGINRLSIPIKGYGVNLSAVMELIIREQRLHQMSRPIVQLMIKIDGRPFWGLSNLLKLFSK